MTDNYDLISSFPPDELFEAEVNGVRSRFYKAEHANEGRGWSCLEIDGKLPPHVYGEEQMGNITRLPGTSYREVRRAKRTAPGEPRGASK